MKRRYLFLAALGIGLVTIILGLLLPATIDRAAHARGAVEKSRHHAHARGEEWENRRSGPPRMAVGAVPTHSPERLRDFVLTEISVRDASLREAVEQVMATYREVCHATGELPLELTFSIPEPAPRVSARLKGRDLDSSIRVLAALARMKVMRRGLEYRFDVYDPKTERMTHAIPVPPDFVQKLERLALSPGDPFGTLEEKLAAMGLTLDPSTRITRTPAGELVVETASISDRIAIEAIARLASQERDRQHQLAVKLIEIPAGASWSPPANGELDTPGVQLLMRELASMRGNDLMTMPSVLARDGQEAVVESVREIHVPAAGAEEATTANIGHVLRLGADSLGFGHDVTVDFTHTTGGVTPAGELSVELKTRIESEGFTRDQGTKVIVQTRDDGSRTLLLLSPALIDEAGAPIRVE